MVTLKDIVYKEENETAFSLVGLIGRKIVDVQFTLSRELGKTVIKPHCLVLEDGLGILIKGEHNLPYLAHSDIAQSNLDQKTLNRLYHEQANQYGENVEKEEE